MKIAKWGLFEAWLNGPEDDAAFMDLDFTAVLPAAITAHG